jgi:hypothetical protein
MIIFNQGGNKNLILVILVILFTGIIAWQWVASNPFANVENNNNFLSQIKNETSNPVAEIKNSIDEGKEDLSNIEDKLAKQIKQDQLLEETKKYLEEKEDGSLLVPDNQEACEFQGGEWQAWGKTTEESCNLFTTDGGKECSDSNECEAYCIADLPEILLKDLPLEITGNCTERTTWQGCYSLVEEGLVRGVVCD